MAYLDLILRSITEPALIRAFVKFFLDTEKFDGCRILDSLVERISSPDSNVSLEKKLKCYVKNYFHSFAW